MESRVEKAKALFKEGYNCSQAVCAAYADCFGVDPETALKISCGFGGGMGRMREVCGTVSGMVLLAGMATGNTQAHNQQAKKENYELVRQLAEEFRKKNGSIICRELLGIKEAESDAAPAPRTKEYYKKRPCVELVGDAAEIIERVLFGEDGSDKDEA